MTVEIKSKKSKTSLTAKDPAAKAPGLLDILSIDPLQQGQALLAAKRKRKKQQKRAGLYYWSESVFYIIELFHSSHFGISNSVNRGVPNDIKVQFHLGQIG